MSETWEAYDRTRERTLALVRDADPQAAVPACPEWSVHDLLAHLVGIAEDVVAGEVDGYATDAWTAAQVARARERSVQELAERWTALDLQPILTSPEARGLPPVLPFLVVTDAVTHEHDLRGALGRSDGRDTEAVALALRSYVAALRQRHAEAGLPPLRLAATDDRDWMVGSGEPAATVRAPRFELLRSLSGRRTREQVAAFDWDGDPEPYLDIWIGWPFSWAAAPSDA